MKRGLRTNAHNLNKKETGGERGKNPLKKKKKTKGEGLIIVRIRRLYFSQERTNGRSKFPA